MSSVPTIEYATPDADGLPAFLPEAEAIIDAGGGPTPIRRFFRKRDDAGRYFAKSMARRFDFASIGTACCVCNRHADVAARVEWAVRALPRPFTLTLTATSGTHELMTHHPLCDRCMSAWAQRARRWQIVGGWLAQAKWPLIGALVFAIILVRTSHYSAPWTRFVFLGVLAAILIRPSIMNFVFWRFRRATPKSIRRLARRGMRLVGLNSNFTLESIPVATRVLPVQAVESTT